LCRERLGKSVEAWEQGNAADPEALKLAKGRYTLRTRDYDFISKAR
jgi:hypothetical protein